MLSAVGCRTPLRPNHQLAPTQPLAYKVVRLPVQHQRHPVRGKRPKRLPRRSIEGQRDRRRNWLLRPQQRQLTRHPRAHRPIRIRNLRAHRERLARLHSRKRLRRPSLVKRRMLRRLRIPNPLPAPHPRHRSRQHRGQIQIAVKPHLLQQIRPPNRLLERRQPILRQQAPQVGRQFLKEPHDVLRLAPELRPQLRPLRRNPRRTRIQVALPRHIAPDRHQHRSPKRILIRPEQRRNQHILRRRQATIGPQPHPPAHAVRDQHLLRLGKPQLPRIARILDA